MGFDMGMGLGGMATNIGMDLTQIGHSAIQAKRSREHQDSQWRRRLLWGPGIAMQGLRLAGLNPILAAQGALGPGAGGGGGAAGVIGASRGGDPVNSARTAMLMSAELRNKRLEGNILNEKQQQEWNATRASDYLPATAEANWKLNSARAALEEAQIPGARAYERMDRTEAGQFLRWLNRAIRSGTGRDTR